MPTDTLNHSIDITLSDVFSARTRIAPFVHRTPVLTSSTLNKMAGAELFFKCENFQVAGAFKVRGAHNAVFSLSEEAAKKGVVTHSSGNHAAALSLAARNRGITAHVIMPENAPKTKIKSVERFGGNITLCAPNLAAREMTAREIIARTGATLVHGYDNDAIIAGQGTAALELLEEVPDLDTLVAPVGGGGLLSGAAIVAQGRSPSVAIYGAEPVTVDDAARSLRDGILYPPTNGPTVADGLRIALGQRNFKILRAYANGIATVSEHDIIEALRLVWAVMKITIEPSSAVPVAAVLTGALPLKGKRVGIFLTGGNIDLDVLPWQK